MKNKLLVLSLTAVLALPASARCDGITVTLDGAPIEFDVPPQISEGRTLVPLRAIFEAMGAEVNWDSDSQTVTSVKNEPVKYTQIVMQIGSTEMTVKSGSALNSSPPDIQTITLDVPPRIIDSRTLVPARAVAEGFGAKVEWDGGSQTVTIVSAPEEHSGTIESNKDNTADLIKYDASLEQNVGYMKEFKILSAELNDNGDYDITYTLQTYLEGRGDVSVAFHCLDNTGEIVDSWSRLYHGTDYTWSHHTASVTVSGKTTKIQLAP